MVQSTSTDQRFEKMTREPVEGLICSLAVPTIISMLITSIYNMADTFFVSRISTSASGAVGVAFSLMAIIQAIGFTFGTGAGNYISRLLGQKDRSTAAKVAATGFFSVFGLGVLLSLLGLTNLNALTYALGSTKTIAPYAKDYLRFILIGAPYMASSLTLNNLLRYQGSAYYAMLGIGFGGVLNIILDPIFIFVLDMGIGGAALATIISQFISFIILLRNCSVEGNIRIQFKNFSPCWAIYKEIFRGGLPSFYRQALASTAMINLNFAAGAFGDAAVAAMSIVARVSQFAVSAVLGFGQGFQPVCCFNYGAQQYKRVLKAFWFTVKTAALVLLAIATGGLVFAPKIIALFRREDMAVIITGSQALRYQALALTLSAFIIPANMLLQTIGKGLRASLVAISRQGLFFIPAILYLPRRFGLLGVQISQPLADVLTFFVAVLMVWGVLQELKAKQKRVEGYTVCQEQVPRATFCKR